MHFDNSFAKMPGQFFTRMSPTPVEQPGLIKVNTELAGALGMDVDYLTSAEGTHVLAGNHVPTGSDPIALAYAGHQFGNWVPQLGDGRAILLGEVLGRCGGRFDIQLKGSGPTPYSRNGDGRAWIGPVLREYVVSEAMAALNIPTTRALAAVTTGESVMREEQLPGAVLTRVAQAHIRVGTFEFFAARNDFSSVRLLADHVIDRFYPEARETDNPYLTFFENVLTRQARLVAQWMGVGFIHGVMNTDNMSVAGETIDYGPCAFMDTYHPETVFSYIDHMGRYAYANQPNIAKWNLGSFASALIDVVSPDGEKAVKMLTEALAAFDDVFAEAWMGVFRGKLGLSKAEDGDRALIDDLLKKMAENHADFTLTFRGLSDVVGADHAPTDAPVRNLFKDPDAFDIWADGWLSRLAREHKPKSEIAAHMRSVNPAYIPRNHRIEQMIAAAVDGDYAPFERLLDILSTPFDDQMAFLDFQAGPKPAEVVRQTFCGT